MRRLPTVLTVEICGIEGLNLPHRTVELLGKSTHVKQAALDEQDRAIGKMFAM